MGARCFIGAPLFLMLVAWWGDPRCAGMSIVGSRGCVFIKATEGLAENL